MVRTGPAGSPIYERTIYIDGIFEYCILENGTTYEKNYVHIMGDQSRIAMVRIGTPFPDNIIDVITYNLEDQIGSSSMRLNTLGAVIDKEEYYPFGDSSLRTFSKKRYRYVGKEKDLESGLYYYGARYYAAWTCRFISCDPLSAKYPNISTYAYAFNNPIMFNDPTGLEGENPGGGIEVTGVVLVDNISWEFDVEAPEMPQSYKNGLDITSYNWDKIYDNFDFDGEEILQQEKTLIDLANRETNTCAVKLSNALNRSGYPIPTSTETPPDIRIRTGIKGDSGNFILDAKSMANYLSDIQEPTETYTIKTSEGIDKMIANIHELYDDMYGIIVYVVDKPGDSGYGATGHADLIYEDWGWDLVFYSGTEVGPYLKENVLPSTTFTVYIWVMGYDK